MEDVKYTDEQDDIFTKTMDGWSFVVEAGAGTGKTTTLARAAELVNDGHRRILYVAYNREIVSDSRGAFPPEVTCSTAHGLAYRSIGHRYATTLNRGGIQGWQIAKTLRIGPWRDSKHKLSGPKLASLSRRTVKAWARSTDLEILPSHVPIPESITEYEARLSLQDAVVAHAKRIWGLVQDPNQAALRFDHDWYLKMYSMSGPGGAPPNLGVDVVLFDECQDADPVIRSIVEAQACQRVAVGDSQQAIYGWRGAEDAIARFREKGAPVLKLSRSWRFGGTIADEANVWLDRLDGDIRLTGNPGVESSIGPVGDKGHTILCRTNAGVIAAAIAAVDAGKRVSVVGCDREVLALLLACEKLQSGREVDHPELIGFADWDQLKSFVESPDCDSVTLKTLVKLSGSHSLSRLRAVLTACVAEREAEVVISTSHKAKGRQWPYVKVGADFAPREALLSPEGGASRDQLRLAYVTVTRARRGLDLGILAP